MGQVPTLRYGIVGDGRLARHLSHYFRKQGLDLRTWSRRGGGVAAESLGDRDILLLMISDAAIEPWIRDNPWTEGKRLIHFSGALASELATGFHPLMSFGPTP